MIIAKINTSIICITVLKVMYKINTYKSLVKFIIFSFANNDFHTVAIIIPPTTYFFKFDFFSFKIRSYTM